MSTRDGYMVKIGEIFVHVVCERPLKPFLNIRKENLFRTSMVGINGRYLTCSTIVFSYLLSFLPVLVAGLCYIADQPQSPRITVEQ